jgi:CheY-like chemotaxis protein
MVQRTIWLTEAIVSPRVLVVEDDEIYRYAVATVLANAGYTVEEAASYRRALAVINDNRPLDLILCDVGMPAVNGFALARKARQRRSGLKVAFMTGLDELPIAEITGTVIHKPAEPEVVVGTVRRLLDPALSKVA